MNAWQGKFRKLILASVIGGALTAPGFAQAITLDTTSAANVLVSGNPGEGAGGDGILQNFTGVDWNSNGSAWVQNFNVPAVIVPGVTFIDFILTYQAFAGSLATTSGTPDLRVASPGSGIGTYEITTYATVYERATCVTAACNIVLLSLTPGQTNTFEVRFDSSPDADAANGTGFRDGDVIFSGILDSQDPTSSFVASAPAPGGSGSGSANLSGVVTFTNASYVNPALVGTTVGTDIDFPGEGPPNFTPSLAFDGVPVGGITASNFVLQVDARQTIQAVPEPGSIALLGSALLGLGAMRFRARKRS